ncbi:MAG: PTS sugar transporter subunit IIC [Candidatus Eisenbacteria bacterium]|uniref:PTS sugar transporter subunit IIC n=1 Tax=Eiseniibacteriota bacterium TaxID=2212470 RepID=A0A933SB39_UNCEI|nr:PTS sugar transporter subunit IIC [Candidatus Eisenbacteria bacterium]
MNTHVAFVVTVLLGGVAALDATPVAQTLLSQPLVTATILGWLWNDWHTALAVGVVLQLLAASTLPVGSRTPEDYAVGGVAGTGVALALAHGVEMQPWRDAAQLAGVMVGMVSATAGVPLIRWQRRRNEGLSRWCEGELRAGNEAALGQAHAAGVALAFAVGVASVALWLAAGTLGLRGFVEHESLRLSRAWTVLQPLWLGFALAQLLNAFVQRRLTRAAIFGASMIGAWLTLVMGMP